MMRASFAVRFASESKPIEAMPRKRRPLTSPTSISRSFPAASTATASRIPVGIPIAAREVVAAAAGEDPDRRVPAGERAADLADQPVAAHDHGQLPGLVRRQRLLDPVLEAARDHGPEADPRRGQRLFGVREQRLAAPAPRGGIDDQNLPALGAHAAQSSRDEIGPIVGAAALDDLEAAPLEAAPQDRVRGVERRLRAPARRDHGVTAWPQDPRDLGEEGRHVELGDEVERILAPGQRGGVADAEGDPALGIQTDPRLSAADHLLGDVDAADAGVGELARDQQCPRARSRCRCRALARGRG